VHSGGVKLNVDLTVVEEGLDESGGDDVGSGQSDGGVSE
jgi:hypothetical protein